MKANEFEKMADKKKREIYRGLWGNQEFNYPIKKKYFRGQESDNSYSFFGINDSKTDKCNKLMDIFDVSNKELFESKYLEICNQGKEGSRIDTLHSSSLCALLFFYNVTTETPLYMKIEGVEYQFYKSIFEYKNPVINGGGKSCVDVVLIGECLENTENVVLFLESKFSEYFLHTGCSHKVSKKYLNNDIGEKIYCDNKMESISISVYKEIDKEIDNGDNFTIKSSKSCYLEGIKQMVSHYIGVRNTIKDSYVPNKGKDNDKVEVYNMIRSGAKIMLGEILFTDVIGKQKIGRQKEECLESYKSYYSGLASILNEVTTNEGISNFRVLDSLISYDCIKGSKCVDPEVIRFYYDFRA